MCIKSGCELLGAMDLHLVLHQNIMFTQYQFRAMSFILTWQYLIRLIPNQLSPLFNPPTNTLLFPVEPFNEASTLSLSTLAVPQILYSTELILASGLDQEGGTVVQGRLRQLSVLYL